MIDGGRTETLAPLTHRKVAGEGVSPEQDE